MYQLIKYNRDSGADEGPEYNHKRDAIAGARHCGADAALVYDLTARRIVAEFGYFPDREKPTEGRRHEL